MELTLDAVLAAVREHGTVGKAAKALGLTPKQLENRVYRNGWADGVSRARAEHAAAKVAPDSLEITGEGSLPLSDLDALLRSRGLGTQWIVKGGRVGEWEQQTKEGDSVTLHSIRAEIVPVEDLVLPAGRDRPKRKPVVAKPPRKGKPQLGVVLSDQHIPFVDWQLHARILRWLRDVQPQRIVLLGDLLDLDSMSRHPWDAKWNSMLQQAIDEGYDYIESLREACPDAQIDYLHGNHEDRRRQKVIERLREMYGVRRARSSHSVLTLEYLLALDELGVTQHTDEDLGYAHSQIRLAPGLVARHGQAARQGAGASALAELERATHGVVMGHTHRQGLVRRTLYDDFNEPRAVWACEAGTLALTKGGMGYTPRPDWQQGCASFLIWEDGSHELELAPVVDGTLRWRGQRW